MAEYPIYPSTDAGWCKWFERLDRTFGTSTRSPLHHDNRCPLHCR